MYFIYFIYFIYLCDLVLCFPRRALLFSFSSYGKYSILLIIFNTVPWDFSSYIFWKIFWTGKRSSCFHNVRCGYTGDLLLQCDGFFCLTLQWLLNFCLFLGGFFFIAPKYGPDIFIELSRMTQIIFSRDVIALLELTGAYLLVAVPPPAINVEFDIYSSMIQSLRFYEVPFATLCRQL